MTYREEFEVEWQQFYTVLRVNKYDSVIPGVSDPANESSLRDWYIKAFNCVVTRCFGWGLPCTTLVPFADCINHHNVDSSYDMINAEWKPLSYSERNRNYPDLVMDDDNPPKHSLVNKELIGPTEENKQDEEKKVEDAQP